MYMEKYKEIKVLYHVQIHKTYTYIIHKKINTRKLLYYIMYIEKYKETTVLYHDMDKYKETIVLYHVHG